MQNLSDKDFNRIINALFERMNSGPVTKTSAKRVQSTAKAHAKVPDSPESYSIEVIDTRAKFPKAMFEHGHCTFKMNGEIIADLVKDSEDRAD